MPIKKAHRRRRNRWQEAHLYFQKCDIRCGYYVFFILEGWAITRSERRRDQRGDRYPNELKVVLFPAEGTVDNLADAEQVIASFAQQPPRTVATSNVINHVNTGEGFALYVNGKLLAESKSGVGIRQGGQPRGGHIYNDFRDDFKGGKVTIAATSFLRYNHPRHGLMPPQGHFTLWIEEQKIPPVKAAVASDQ